MGVDPPVGEADATTNEEEQDENVTQMSLFDFVNQLIHNEESDEGEFEALEFLKKYVGSLEPAEEEDQAEEGNDNDDENAIGNGGRRYSIGKIIESEEEAKEVICQLTPRVRKAILSFLGDHIQNASHRKNPTQKDLVGWLQQSNALREYAFYKVAGLKALIKDRGITLGPGRKSADEYKDILAGIVDVGVENGGRASAEKSQRAKRKGRKGRYGMSAEDAKADCIEAVLKKSFLPHQKGQAREHCSLGHRLEIPILKSWIKVAKGDESPVQGLTIKGAYTAGLAAKKGVTYAKDSIDFLVTLQETQGPLKVWGFEAKGRVTTETAAAEERELHYLNNPHVRVCEKDANFEISAESERFQILQHAFVYNLDSVVLAISDNQSSLIRSIIVDFSTELKTKFGNVLEKLMQISLKWAYPAALPNPTSQTYRAAKIVDIPPEIFKIGETMDQINCPETLQGTANLWYAMNKLQKPFPSFFRLIPAIYAYWNVVKGGSDTATKLMDDCLVRIPKVHINAETVAVTRLLQLVQVLFHRLHQVFTAKEDVLFYPDLLHYRKAASQRSTFHETLLLCNEIIMNELENRKENNTTHHNEESATAEALSSTPRPHHQTRRRNPTRQLVDGVRPQRIAFGSTLSTITPKKISKMVEKGKASLEIDTMVKQCTGMPMKAYPVRYNRCERCKSQTSWYCVGCKRWLCLDRRALKDNSKSLNLYAHTIKGTERTFSKLCFHLEHEEAWNKISSTSSKN